MFGISFKNNKLEIENALLKKLVKSQKRVAWDVANKNRLTHALSRKSVTASGAAMWQQGGKSLRDISRYLTRNHPTASRGVDYFAQKILGKDGILPSFSTPDAGLNDELAAAFVEWATAVDMAGSESFSSVQEIWCREISVAGEAFCHWGVDRGRFVLSCFESKL